MNLLIVAATKFEIEPFFKEKTLAEILITGVGIPATVYHLTKKLSSEKYDFVIQAGIAGSFSDEFNLAEVVQVKEDTFADLGIEEKGNFRTLFDMGFINKSDFPFTNGWLMNPAAFSEKNNLPFAKGITVNKIGDDQLQNKMIREKFLPDIESMEGAAFHYVCLQQKNNFLQLRSISNRVGERDKSKWKLKESIENLNKELLKIIENF
ncbi:MAG TPA: futalosine hydrolase [Hanamia sp.]|jgi:futalosine hydrolase|nr:futalosine hydrolase [Hanamia sp.]